MALFWATAEPAVAARNKTTAVRETIVTPEVFLAAPPLFLQPQEQQYFVAVEIPYDLFYLGGTFFLSVRGTWFTSDFFEGPWERLEKQRLPVVFRESKIQSLREIREQTTTAYATQKSSWPMEKMFFPENNLTEDDLLPIDDDNDSDAVPAGFEPNPELLNSKGE